jgi:hypothetical protein
MSPFPAADQHERLKDCHFMTKPIWLLLYVLLMIIVIVGFDLLFFKDRFWARLMVNIGIVLVFAAFYLRYLK